MNLERITQAALPLSAKRHYLLTVSTLAFMAKDMSHLALGTSIIAPAIKRPSEFEYNGNICLATSDEIIPFNAT